MLKSKYEGRISKRVDEKFKLCPSCGNFSDYESNEIYCIVCGSRLLECCPGCREPIYYPTAKFCPVCGEKYRQE